MPRRVMELVENRVLGNVRKGPVFLITLSIRAQGRCDQYSLVGLGKRNRYLRTDVGRSRGRP